MTAENQQDQRHKISLRFRKLMSKLTEGLERLVLSFKIHVQDMEGRSKANEKEIRNDGQIVSDWKKRIEKGSPLERSRQAMLEKMRIEELEANAHFQRNKLAVYGPTFKKAIASLKEQHQRITDTFEEAEAKLVVQKKEIQEFLSTLENAVGKIGEAAHPFLLGEVKVYQTELFHQNDPEEIIALKDFELQLQTISAMPPKNNLHLPNDANS